MGILKHIHLLVRADIEKPEILPEELSSWFEELVEKVGMEILIPPVSKYCDDPNNLGCTGMVGITTSHSSMHVWEKEKYLMMDLYSCKDFDFREVIRHIHAKFSIVTVDFMLIDRTSMEVLETGSSYRECHFS